MKGNTTVIRVKRYLDGLPMEAVSLDVYIPENYRKNLFIKTTSGIVKIDPMQLTEFSCITSSGGLNTDKLTADRMTVHTTSGFIRIIDLDSGELKINGTSSDVTITCKELRNQSIDVVTTSGNTTVQLPGDAEFEYEVITNGKFESNFPIDIPQNTSRKNSKGIVGDKNNKVSIQASSGNITLAIEE